VSSIRAVCFDIGGVLAHVALSWDAAMVAAGFKAGPSYEIPLEVLGAFKLFQAGQLDIEAYLDELGDYLGLNAAAALRVHESILLRPTEGTLEIIEALNSKSVTTGCLSNTNTLHWSVLTDPARYPNVAALKIKAASQVIGHNKPAEEAYRAFESLTGAAGSQILFFEDGESNVAAAAALGWNAVLVDPQGDQAKTIRAALNSAGLG